MLDSAAVAYTVAACKAHESMFQISIIFIKQGRGARGERGERDERERRKVDEIYTVIGEILFSTEINEATWGLPINSNSIVPFLVEGGGEG